MQTLFCPECGWRLDGEIGMKPECPDCKSHLILLRGTKEEIDRKTMEPVCVQLEEGDLCGREGCLGTMEYPPVENCACHIAPPCSACVDNELECNVCGRTQE